MDSKFQSSFIPKTGLGGSTSTLEKKETYNVFGGLAVVIFVVSLLGLGGVFAYTKITENAITNLETELANAQASVDKTGIDNLSAFDQRIKAIKAIIGNHVAVSGYLALLEGTTLSNVEFKNLKYSAPTSGGEISIVMDGRAGSYAAVAQEESILLKNPDTTSVTFSNLSLEKESGGVSFALKGIFKSSLIKFQTLPSGVPVIQAKVSTTTATSTSKSMGTSTKP